MTFPVFTSALNDPRGRGLEFGRRWSAEIRTTLTGYTELFAVLGGTDAMVRAWSEQALATTAAWSGDLAAEISAIASGAGLEPWQVAALNSRTEILAALGVDHEGECSTSVALAPDGTPPRTIQTWDWHDHLRDVPVVWEFETRHRVRTFTEFGVLAKIGVNGSGLGVHFNILRHSSDHAGMGVPVHLVARRILAEATGMDEAVAIARSARVSASTVITVVTYGGERADARALEICPEGVAVIPARPDGMLLHANHFLDPGLAAGEKLGSDRPGTYARIKHLEDRAGALRAADPTERAAAMLCHAEDGAPVCAHADTSLPLHERWETVATIALDVAGGHLHAHRGGPCQVQASTWQTM